MLHHLIYHCNATAEITSTFAEGILEECRKLNTENNVTGCLLVNKQQFVQLIEGEQSALEKIFNSIRADNRCSDVSLIENRMVERRLFPMSSMVYEVVGKDDFSQIGAEGKEDLSFLTKNPEQANLLFNHVRKLMDQEPMRQGLWHNARLGPLA